MRRAVVVLILALASSSACKRDESRALRERAETTWEEAARQSRYLVEVGKDGAVTAWRETERVGGQAGEELTDAVILAAVKGRFLSSRDVQGTRIDVDVRDHVVTLKGRVRSLGEAQRAVAVALDTRGVERVISHLTVAAAP